MSGNDKQEYGLKDEILGRVRPGEKRSAMRRAAIFLGYPVVGGRAYIRRFLPISESAQLLEDFRRSGLFGDQGIHFVQDESGAFLVPDGLDTAYLAQYAHDLSEKYGQRSFVIKAGDETLARLWPFLRCYGSNIQDYTPPTDLRRYLESGLQELKSIGGAPLFLGLWVGHGRSLADLKKEIQRTAVIGWLLVFINLAAWAVFLRLCLNWLKAEQINADVVTLLYGAAFVFILGVHTLVHLFRQFRLRKRAFPSFKQWIRQPSEWLPRGELS